MSLLSNVFTKKWCRAAAIRAMKTIAQTMVATMSASTMLENVDWKVVVSSSLLAGLVSVLTSIGGLPEVDYDGKNEPLIDVSDK